MCIGGGTHTWKVANSNVDEQEYLCYIFYVEREDARVDKISTTMGDLRNIYFIRFLRKHVMEI